MKELKTYLPWLGLCAVALLSIVLFPGAPAPPLDASRQDMLPIKDPKLRRTVDAFLSDGRPKAPRRFHEENRPGVPVAISIPPDILELMLVKSNRELYQTRWTPVQIRFGQDEPIPASLAPRGHGSLDASDKMNFKIKFPEPFRITKDVRIPRMLLIAMSFDPDEFRVLTGLELMRELKLYTAHAQYISVSINGVPQGAYLLMDPAENGLRRTNKGTVAVYRRRKPNVYEMKWEDDVPRTGENLRKLQKLVREADPATPLSAYSAVFDVDGYARYSALCSVLRNSDWLDELFLYETRSDPNTPTPLRTMGWDLDDVLAEHEDKHAFPDPLMFSACAPLDKAILGNPELYERFRQVMVEVLTEHLTEPFIRKTVQSVVNTRNGFDDGLPADVQTQARRERTQKGVEYAKIVCARRIELLQLCRTEPE